MECRKAKLKITLLSEGKLDPQEIGDLDRHLSECPCCREEARTDSLACAALSLLGPLEPRDGGWKRLQERLQAEGNLRRRPVWRAAAAFAVTVLAVAAVLVHLIVQLPVEPQKAVDARPVVKRLPPRRTAAVKTGSVQPKPTVRKPEEEVPVQKRQTAVAYTREETPRRVWRHEPSVERVRRHRVTVSHPKPVSEPAVEPVDDAVPAVEPETVAQGAQEVQPPAEYSSVATYAVSSEMGDLISEGMSALVEAGKDLSHSGKEKQL